jgi:hypothetical protein
MPDDATCAAQSLHVGEPLAGTAVAETDLWIALEHPGPWGPKGLEDSALPAELVAQLRAFTARQPRARVQLIRKPERTGDERLLFLARGEPGAASSYRLTLDGLGALAAVDLDAWAAGAAPSAAQQSRRPLYLVCVHGKRDRCCAQRGMPVYSALTAIASDDVWQTTHLGGHRFAATLLVLPEGVCYGRLDAAEATALAAAHARGELYDVSRMRGRCAYASEVQAAEVALRQALGELRLDALRWLGAEQVASGVRVRFQHLPEQREHELEVRSAALPPAPSSCNGPLKPGQCFVALRRTR